RRRADADARARMPRRTRARLRFGPRDRGPAADSRTQHRPFSYRRSDLCRSCRQCEMHARGDGGGAGGRRGATVILGVGSDLCDIRRIEETLARYGERFIGRCFTETERRKSEGRAARAASYAKRFAAKEACAKALGTGLRHGVYWRDMGVVKLASGRSCRPGPRPSFT